MMKFFASNVYHRLSREVARVGAYVQCWKCLHFWKYDKTKMFIADGYEKVVCPSCKWDNCLKAVKKTKDATDTN